jgi:hypothetical protein
VIAAKGVEAWHRVARHMTSEALDEVLAEDVVFQSPIVHTPQKGREITKLYLMAAANVLPGDADDKSGARSEAGSEDKVEATAKGDLGAGNFGYVREVIGERDAVLEFVTVVDGITVNGVDMIRWNDEGKIIDFKVMVRPLKAVQKLHAQMAAMLESMKKA